MHRRPVPSGPEWSHARLLLIEDDADQRRLLTLLLKRERFDVTACSTVEEALQVLPHGKFAVAVVDLSLPGKGGIDFVKEVAARKEKTRVIIHTGYGSFETAKEGLNLGVFAYVEKIGNFDSLLEHVRSAATDYLHESLSLAEDEILFQLRLLDAVEEGVVATNLDAEIIYWNRAAERLTGWLHEDVFGKNFYETVAAEDSVQLQTAMQERLQSGLAWIGELRLKKLRDHSDESATVATEIAPRLPQESLAAIPVRFSLSPVWNSDDSPAGYIGTFADITIEKAAELELMAHARRQAVGAQLGLYAASETDPDKFMVRLAQSVCEALEADSLDILQWQSSDATFVLRAGHGHALDRTTNASVSGGERSIAGYVYRTKETIALECESSDNRFDMESWASDAELQAAVVTPISVSVNGFGVMAVRCRRRRVFSAAEIDFIKMVGNLLAGTIERRELLSRWQSLFQNTLDAVVLTDDKDCCVEVNAAACKILGYRHDELIGMKMANLIADEGPEGGVNPWRHDGGRNRTAGQVWLKSSSGELVCTEYRVVSHVIPGMHLCDFRDITEQKRTAELLQQQQSHLAHVQRVATLGQMAAVLAHEINQPLGAISNFSGGLSLALRRSTEIPPDLGSTLEQINEQALRAGEIVRRLRRLNSPVVVEPSLVDLNQIVQDTSALISGDLAFRQTNLDLKLADNLPLIFGDPIQLQQVLVNLLKNAAEAVERLPRDQRRVSVLTKHDGENVVVHIRDWGQISDPTILDRLFEPYFSTKGDGLGMGLCISKSIVEQHQGEIGATMNPDAGLTFTIKLPAADSPLLV